MLLVLRFLLKCLVLCMNSFGEKASIYLRYKTQKGEKRNGKHQESLRTDTRQPA